MFAESNGNWARDCGSPLYPVVAPYPVWWHVLCRHIPDFGRGAVGHIIRATEKPMESNDKVITNSPTAKFSLAVFLTSKKGFENMDDKDIVPTAGFALLAYLFNILITWVIPIALSVWILKACDVL